MLNELYQLSEALKSAGIAPKEWHKNFKPLPKVSFKNPCCRIFIANSGEISGIDVMTEETVSKLRKWEPSNGSSFPGFNIQPLYRIVDDDRKKLIKKWREGKSPIDLVLLKSWCSEEKSLNWNGKIKEKLIKCLNGIPQELSESITEIPEIYEAYKKLIERVSKDKFTSSFHNTLESYIWNSLEKSENVSTILPILTYETGADKNPEKDRGSISIFLDVPDWKEYPVAHENTITWMNDNFIQARKKSSRDGNALDAFGLPMSNTDEKLPEVKLPIIAGVKLRSMNKESPCQYRYETIDAKSFSIGQESRKQVKGALEWLGDIEREGMTWGRASSKELLFAYPMSLPKSPIKLASCFGALKREDQSARFSDYAKNVVESLRGICSKLRDVEFEVFSLKKMDKARTKVVFHRNYTAQRLADAAEEWEKGCANIPSIDFRAWGEKKGEVIIVKPETPFPLQIAMCLNRVWKLEGKSECETQSIPITAGMELLLDEQASRLVPHLLAVALQNTKGLSIYLGNSMSRGESISLKNEIDKHKQLVPSILGLLLHKLGITKENYMNENPYLIGKMLKIADELHALYCKEVRKGKLPPQLLGNALMVAALESPEQALAQLALRLVPYLGWARTNKTDSAGLSRYFLKCYADIEVEIDKSKLPSRLNDACRAQLLLGYLASNTENNESKK